MGFRALRLRDRFDLVHVHAHPVRLQHASGVPLVMSEGSSSAVYLGDYLGWDDDRIAGAYRRARRLYRALGVRDRLLALEKVTKAYVFSEWARHLNIRWGADPGKLEVIPPGFPTPSVATSRGEGPFSFLFLGTDFERKGGFDVVEAFDRVRRDNPAVRLVLAGSRPEERNPDRRFHSWVGQQRRDRVLARMRELKRDGAVEVRGAIATGVADSLYAAADAFLMPSLAEGFGFTNVEAMSHALPVISSESRSDRGDHLPRRVRAARAARGRGSAQRRDGAAGRGAHVGADARAGCTRGLSSPLHDRAVQGAARGFLPACRGRLRDRATRSGSRVLLPAARGDRKHPARSAGRPPTRVRMGAHGAGAEGHPARARRDALLPGGEGDSGTFVRTESTGQDGPSLRLPRSCRRRPLWRSRLRQSS